MDAIKKNIATTAAGAAGGFGLLAWEVWKHFDGDPLTVVNGEMIVIAVTVVVGFFLAKDGHKDAK